MLDRQTRQNIEMRPKKVIVIHDDYDMNIGDTDLLVSAMDYDWNLFLPPVGEAKGIGYLIKYIEGTYQVIVSDSNDTTEGLEDIILSKIGQSVKLESDGEIWVKTDLFNPKTVNSFTEIENPETEYIPSVEEEKVRAERERIERLKREEIARENEEISKIPPPTVPRVNVPIIPGPSIPRRN